MATSFQLERPDEVASKVMRRVQVSKMTRALQDRLALASVKIQNGWENLSLDAIEPQMEERLRRRKRPASSNDTISDTASTTSSRLHSSNGMASSPITEPLFSDDYQRSGGSFSRRKRLRQSETNQNPTITSAVTGRRTRGAANRQNTWKKNEGLAESSPIKTLQSSPIKDPSTRHARFPSHQVSHLSFISEGSTIADEPHSPEFSEEDDADLPVTSFSVNNSSRPRIASSPPHTPPPERQMRSMRNKAQHVSWSRTPRTGGGGDDGADLLMYLATSPSPAIGGTSRSARQPVLQPPPTTPPCKSTPLPSSHMTPGMTGHGFLGGFSTPGQANSFDFGDFVTFTPTPGASARRKLNFDPISLG